MKTNIYLLAVGLLGGSALSACSNDQVFAEMPAPPVTENVSGSEDSGIRFAARIIQGLDYWDAPGTHDAATRAVWQEGQFAGWTAGDALMVSDSRLARTYEVTETDGTSCTLRVRQGDTPFTEEEGGEAPTFYAFYPEKAVTDADGRGDWFGPQVSAMLFAEQDYAENADGGSFGGYMAAEGAPLKDGRVDFAFYPVSSVIEVDVSALGEGVIPTAVSVKSNSGVSLSGLFTYDCAARTAKVSTVDNTACSQHSQSDVVTVSGLPEGVTTVRLYVLPVQLQGGVTLTVRDAEGRFYTRVDNEDVGEVATEGLTAIDGVEGAQVCTPYYKRYVFGTAADAPRINNWMATIPGNVRLKMLSIPGAHDAATSGVSGLLAGSAKTQTYDIATQLAGGVRAFDLRPRYNSNKQEDIELENLEIYHGPVATGVRLKDAIQTMVDFVENNPTECLYVRIKKENSKLLVEPTDQSLTWRTSVRTCLHGNAPYLVKKILPKMTLADCRGKLLVTADNPYGEEGNLEGVVYGGRLSWTDNTKGTNTVINHQNGSKTVDVYVQDFYSGSVDEKVEILNGSLGKAAADPSDRWYFNFLNFSGSPSSSAKTINEHALGLIAEQTGRLGLVFYDFCLDDEHHGGALNKAIIARNFKYVFDGRTRRKAPAAGE